MLATIAAINEYHEDAGITEVGLRMNQSHWICAYPPTFVPPQPSLMNFVITDGESVVATRYISSRKDAAASLVRMTVPALDPY